MDNNSSGKATQFSDVELGTRNGARDETIRVISNRNLDVVGMNEVNPPSNNFETNFVVGDNNSDDSKTMPHNTEMDVITTAINPISSVIISPPTRARPTKNNRLVIRNSTQNLVSVDGIGLDPLNVMSSDLSNNPKASKSNVTNEAIVKPYQISNYSQTSSDNRYTDKNINNNNNQGGVIHGIDSSTDTVMTFTNGDRTSNAAPTFSGTILPNYYPIFDSQALGKHLFTSNDSIKVINSTTVPYPLRQADAAIMIDDSPKYSRGDLIVTVYPTPSSCIWFTPAKFDCNLTPSEFLDPKLLITADDYSLAMELLTNDYRFTCYNMCYKRVLITWLILGFLILVAILFSGLAGALLFGLGITWLLVNTMGVFLCLLIKKRMNYNLDTAVSTVNRVLVKKNILVGLEDKGKMSCHKIMLHYVYYDIDACLSYMIHVLEQKGLTTATGHIDQVKIAKILDFRHKQQDLQDIVESNSTNYKLNQYQSYAEKVLLRNSQCYIKNFIRGRLTIPHPELPLSKTIRHVKGNFCLCQYVEDYYFLGKERRKWYNAFI